MDYIPTAHTGIMHREEFIADNIIKVRYGVISADWRSADHSYLVTFVCTHMLHNDLLVKLCCSSCY